MNPEEAGFDGAKGLRLNFPNMPNSIYKLRRGPKPPWQCGADHRNQLLWYETTPPKLVYCNENRDYFELSFTRIQTQPPCTLRESTVTQEHPVTPSDALVQQWFLNAKALPPNQWVTDIAHEAARWGADQQLEQDATWLDTKALFSRSLTVTPPGDVLRQAMRPKPLSLKEEALKALDSFEGFTGSLEEVDIIRRALEQLDD